MDIRFGAETEINDQCNPGKDDYSSMTDIAQINDKDSQDAHMIMRFSLLENAIGELFSAFSNLDGFLDCLCEEIRDAKDGTFPGELYLKSAKDSFLKDSISHLFSGCELMFKSALYYTTNEKNSIIVKKQKNKITDEQFEKGEFKSILFHVAAEEIDSLFKVNYYKEGNPKSVNLFLLKNIRNSIEHSSVKMHINTAITLWFSAWQELSAFCDFLMLPVLKRQNQIENYHELCKEYLRLIDFYKRLDKEAKVQDTFDFQIEI